MDSPDNNEAHNGSSSSDADNKVQIDLDSIHAIQEELSSFVVLYRYLPIEAFESTLDNWSLKATLSYEANDPLEMTPAAYTPFGKAATCINSREHDPNPFICFSRVISSPAMWGHYADSGKGVCMVFMLPIGREMSEKWGYKTNNFALRKLLSAAKRKGNTQGFSLKAPNGETEQEQQEGFTASYLLPIRYTQKRVPSLTRHLENNGITDDVPYRLQLPYIQQWSQDLISTKAASWQYEEEVRLICSLSHASGISQNKVLYKWPMSYLVGVVAGPRCPYSKGLIQRKLELAYDKVKDTQPNYLRAQTKLLYEAGFVVTDAKYHWDRFEIEAQPWNDRLEGWGVAYNLLLGHLNQHVDLREVGEHIDSWNDYQDRISKTGYKRQLAGHSPYRPASSESNTQLSLPATSLEQENLTFSGSLPDIADSIAISGFTPYHHPTH